MRGEGRGGRKRAEVKILTKDKDGQRRAEEGRRVHRKRWWEKRARESKGGRKRAEDKMLTKDKDGQRRAEEGRGKNFDKGQRWAEDGGRGQRLRCWQRTKMAGGGRKREEDNMLIKDKDGQRRAEEGRG
jgi:hypothetical protein